MCINTILYRGLVIVAVLALLLPTVFLATTAASPLSPARPLLSPADNNAGWEEVGPGSASSDGISNNQTGGAYAASLAIAPNGTPYVAWQDYTYTNTYYEIYVRRWNGASWEEVGTGSATGEGISDGDGNVQSPSMAIAPNGTPYVAWQHDAGNDSEGEIYVRRWNGASWEEVGAGSASGEGISDTDDESQAPSLAIAPDGTPYVAWYEQRSWDKTEIYVRRWNGNSWEEVGAGSASGGGVSNNDGWSDYPSLAIAPNGTPYVAWTWKTDINGDDAEIYVRRWNGSAWEEVGSGSASGGGISNTGGNSWRPSLAIAPNGTPYVAWAYYGGHYWGIYIRRWNGSNWEEVGAGSAGGEGISNTPRSAYLPSTAIAPDNTPYVAWSNGDSDLNLQIYVRRWNGNTWEEVSTGSASGRGISNGGDDSRRASIAVAPDGTPYAAWEYNGRYNYEWRNIYVRRWVGLPTPTLGVTPTELTFLVQAGAANPSPRRISVDNVTMDDAIAWTASISPTVGWLDVTPISGTTPAIITATVDASGFSTLIVETQIIVDGGDEVLDSPQTIPVKLVVVEEIYDVHLPVIFKNH
jgi:hypothetical protein